MKKSAMVIDDGDQLEELICYLTDRDWAVFKANSWDCIVGYFEQFSPQLLVINKDVPFLSKLEQARITRQRSEDFPILVVSKNQLGDNERIKGFQSGVCTFVEVPFSNSVIEAQMSALLQLSQHRKNSHCKKTVCLSKNRMLTYGDDCIELNERESRIMSVFLDLPNDVVTKNQLQDAIWGFSHDAHLHALDNCMHQFRRKLDRLPGLSIRSIYSKGYVLVQGEGTGGSDQADELKKRRIE